MPYVVDLLPSARRELARLPASVQERIVRRLTALEADPRPRGTILLQGAEGLRRLRVGDYRITYRVDDDALVVDIVRVAHRREAYRR